MDQVTFRENRNADRIVQQDQRNNQQRAAEQQQHQVEFIDVGRNLLDHVPLVDHLVDPVPRHDLLLEGRQRPCFGRTSVQFHLVGIRQRIRLQKFDEIASQIGLEIGRRLVFRNEFHFPDRGVRLQLPLYRSGSLLRNAVFQHHEHRHVLFQPVRSVQRAEDQVSHRAEQKEHQRDADRRNNVGIPNLAFDFPVIVYSHNLISYFPFVCVCVPPRRRRLRPARPKATANRRA